MKRFLALAAGIFLLTMPGRLVAQTGPVTVIGKSYSPIRYYVDSPNKGPIDDKVFKRGSDILGAPSMEDLGSVQQPDSIVVSKQKMAELEGAGFRADKITIKQVPVGIGDKVKDDQIIATYDIPLENIIIEKERLARTKLNTYEYLLSGVNASLEKVLSKQRELSEMRQYDSAAAVDISQNAREIEVMRKRRDYLLEMVHSEKQQYLDKLETSESIYGKGVGQGIFPKEGFIRAPMDGYVLWMNFDLRPGAVFSKRTALFQVGVLDPMAVRCAVHEIQAVKLKVGDPATVVFHTMPDKVYNTTVSKVSFVAQPAMLQQPSFYEIELMLPNPDLTLKEGLRCDVTITPGG